MSKPKHTPGPWHISTETDGHTTIYKETPEQALGVDVLNGDPEDIQDILIPAEQRLANAHLMAAAPEMLECLEDILNYTQVHGQFGLDFSDDTTLEEVLISVIAKAKNSKGIKLRRFW